MLYGVIFTPSEAKFIAEIYKTMEGTHKHEKHRNNRSIQSQLMKYSDLFKPAKAPA